MFHFMIACALAQESAPKPLPQPEPVVLMDPLTRGQHTALNVYAVTCLTGVSLALASTIPYGRATKLQSELEDPFTHFANEEEFNLARDKYGRSRTTFHAMLLGGVGLVVLSPLPIIISLETEKDRKSLTVSGRF